MIKRVKKYHLTPNPSPLRREGRILAVASVFLGLFFVSKCFATDLMEQAFEPAKNYQAIIDVWTTKEAVGNNLLKQSQTVGINENFWQWCFVNGQHTDDNQENCTIKWWDWNVPVLDVNKREPLIVRITKFLLRVTMVLAITMVIISWLYYMVEVINGKDFWSAEAKKNLILIAWGIVLALSSVGIINLIWSVTKSSVKTSDDLGSTIACNTWWVMIAGENLKKYICEHSTFWTNYVWTRDGNRIGNRCNRNGDWKAITNTEMRDKCVNDMWWESVN